MKKLSLTILKSGKKGKIIEVAGGAALQGKLMSMGIYPGKDIVKLSHFALRGPVMIKAGRTTVALGHSMASKIIVEAE